MRGISAIGAFYQEPVAALLDTFTAFRIYELSDAFKLLFGQMMDRSPTISAAKY